MELKGESMLVVAVHNLSITTTPPSFQLPFHVFNIISIENGKKETYLIIYQVKPGYELTHAEICYYQGLSKYLLG